jgi:small subunit ribosomal protein S1
VKHPSKLLAQGTEVEAVVLDIDPKAKRISLGMKQIEPNPWTLLEDKYPIGSVIKGQV